MNRPERPKTKLVEVPSTNIIPERDIGMPPILETRHLGIDFGGLTAVSDFNFAVGRTEIAGLIGPNGAGKTTIFNLLTKVYQPTRGTILLDGMDTAGKTTIQVNHMGIARTFQNIRLFRDLSRARQRSRSACTTRRNTALAYGNVPPAAVLAARSASQRSARWSF